MIQSSTTAFAFLSYAHVDRDLALRLHADLQDRGIATWIDQQDIEPGTPDWEQAVRQAIRTARAVVLLATPVARNSQYVKDELRIATIYQRTIYPFWTVGEEWMECIPLGLGSIQYIDARANRYETGLGTIATLLRESQTDHPFPVPAGISSRLDFEPRNPYKGLRAFTNDDAGDFFGREELVRTLIASVGEIAHSHMPPGNLLTVLGPSGSGKSSVVMAGLLPLLRQGVLPGSEKWVYLRPMRPGANPLEELMLIVASQALAGKSMKAMRDDLNDEEAKGLYWQASRLVPSSDAKVLLVIDQFEELFTQTVTEKERKQFIRLLINAVSTSRSSVLVVVTFRSDFFARLMQYPELYQMMDVHRVSVLPMETQDIRSVIEQPARLSDVQLTFEDDLVGDLLFETREQVGALPLLEFTLEKLFKRRRGHLLTLDAYREIGGVKGALSKHAEETYQALPSDEHRKEACGIFLRLVDLGVGEQDVTRRRALLSEFILSHALQTRLRRETLDAFIEARLLTTNEIGGKTTVEVSHEALIREWTRLSGWLLEARRDVSLQQTITRDVDVWEQQRRPNDRLYRGSQLKEARMWLVRNTASHMETAFIYASVWRQRQVRVRVLLLAVLVVGVLSSLSWLLFKAETPSPMLMMTPAQLNPTSPNCTTLASTDQCVVTLKEASSSSNSVHWTTSTDIQGHVTFNPSEGNLFPGESIPITISAIPCKDGSFTFLGSGGTTYLSVLWRCTTSAGTIPGTLLRYKRITVTIDVNGLLQDSPAAIRDLEEEIKRETLLQGQNVGLAMIYGGATNDASIAQAQEISAKVVRVCTLLGQQGFAFQRTLYSDPLFILGGNPKVVIMDVFLIQP